MGGGRGRGRREGGVGFLGWSEEVKGAGGEE